MCEVDGKKRKQIGDIAESVRSFFKAPSPIDMEDAVKLLGGTIEFTSDSRGHEATIRKDGSGSFIIRLDENKPPFRQTFSLAHELGHLILHMGFGKRDIWTRSEDYQESYARSGWSEEEYEANEFAAAFLMPSEEFRAVASKSSLKSVAEHFGVSADAALTRGRFLGVYPWS